MGTMLHLHLQFITLALLLLSSSTAAYRPRPSILKRKNPSFTPLSTEPSLSSLLSLSNHSILDFNDPSSLLSQLLVPRVPESKSLRSLQTTLCILFEGLGWTVEKDIFTTSTPIGDREFHNLIFTHDPTAPLQLILSAHLDSKYFPPGSNEEGFVGATDSAAPVAIIVDTVVALNSWLNARKERIGKMGGEEGGYGGQREGLKVVLFDGEEAFHDWTHEDSIYGAKHLASLWSQPSSTPAPSHPLTPISQISHLILLDLLGAPNPQIHSFFPQTGWLFDEFYHAEQSLIEIKALKGQGKMFVERNKGYGGYGGGIEDDHLPFLERSVPVVHLIPLPFPNVWHTIKDDVTALDLPTIENWAMVLRLTIAQYLGLEPEATALGKDKGKRDELGSR